MLNQMLIMLLLFTPASSNNIYQGTKIENQITLFLVDMVHSFIMLIKSYNLDQE